MGSSCYCSCSKYLCDLRVVRQTLGGINCGRSYYPLFFVVIKTAFRQKFLSFGDFADMSPSRSAASQSLNFKVIFLSLTFSGCSYVEHFMLPRNDKFLIRSFKKWTNFFKKLNLGNFCRFHF